MKEIDNLSDREAYPYGADVETRKFVRYWFDVNARRELAALSAAIRKVTEDDTREALWCAFSRLIVAKQAGVSLALDLTHSRPHRAFTRAPRAPFQLFLDAVERVLEGCISNQAKNRGPATRISAGDVRKMTLADRSVDLVFTSPPYLNAIDYMRCSKFSLVWMGYSISALRQIRAESIGAEIGAATNSLQDEVLSHLRLKPALSPRMKGILRRYIDDTHRALKEVVRVLAPLGQVVYVLGENTLRGTYVPTSQIVARMGEHIGLQLRDISFRTLPNNRRYLPPPGTGRTALDTRMRREAILTFAAPR